MGKLTIAPDSVTWPQLKRELCAPIVERANDDPNRSFVIGAIGSVCAGARHHDQAGASDQDVSE